MNQSERQTDRQKDRQADRQTDRQTGTDRQTARPTAHYHSDMVSFEDITTSQDWAQTARKIACADGHEHVHLCKVLIVACIFACGKEGQSASVMEQRRRRRQAVAVGRPAVRTG